MDKFKNHVQTQMSLFKVSRYTTRRKGTNNVAFDWEKEKRTWEQNRDVYETERRARNRELENQLESQHIEQRYSENFPSKNPTKLVDLDDENSGGSRNLRRNKSTPTQHFNYPLRTKSESTPTIDEQSETFYSIGRGINSLPNLKRDSPIFEHTPVPDLPPRQITTPSRTESIRKSPELKTPIISNNPFLITEIEPISLPITNETEQASILDAPISFTADDFDRVFGKITPRAASDRLVRSSTFAAPSAAELRQRHSFQVEDKRSSLYTAPRVGSEEYDGFAEGIARKQGWLKKVSSMKGKPQLRGSAKE
ncbi:hypothetical protein HK096_011122, partial [Nowakowskiella sp. JEL0078]